jgi:hypothetical protein
MKTCPECENIRDRDDATEDKLSLCNKCRRKLARKPMTVRLKRGLRYEYPLKERA